MVMFTHNTAHGCKSALNTVRSTSFGGNFAWQIFKLQSINTSPGMATAHTCQECDTAVATVHCPTCNGDFCNKCDESVHKPKFMSAHVRINVAAKKTTLRCTDHPGITLRIVNQMPSLSNCIAHHFTLNVDKKVRYWCTTDRHLICRDCVLFQHKDHACEDLPTASQKAKSAFSMVIQQNIVARKSLVGHINAMKESLQQHNTLFNEAIDEMKRLIQVMLDKNLTTTLILVVLV